MAVAEPCRECGVLDALGRHAGDCPRALEMGLPRLADGEEPIDPLVDEEELLNQARHQPIETAPDPLLTIAREREVVRDVLAHEMWMAYTTASGDAGNAFDAVIFDSEIEALRYAVLERWQVQPLELRRSLLDQANAS